MMNNFTPRAQQTLVLARKEAESLNQFVDVEHLAVGLIKLGQGVHTDVWRKIGFDEEAYAAALHSELIHRSMPPQKKATGNIPYTPAVKKILTMASKEAKRMGHSWVGTEHLLLAILSFDSPAGTLHLAQPFKYDRIRQLILNELDPTSAYSESAEVSFDDAQLGFEVLIDPGKASVEDIAELFGAISNLNRVVGGRGMTFVDCLDDSKILTGGAV